MVKVNIHEHWTRVTRFNPLWVSGVTQLVEVLDKIGKNLDRGGQVDIIY